MNIESLRQFVEELSSQELMCHISFLQFSRRGDIHAKGIHYSVFSSVNSFRDLKTLVHEVLEQLMKDLDKHEKIVEFRWHDNDKWIQEISAAEVENYEPFKRACSFPDAEQKDYEKKSNGFMLELLGKINGEEKCVTLIMLQRPFEPDKKNIRKFVVKGGEFVKKEDKDLNLNLNVDIMIVDDMIYVLDHREDKFFWPDTYIIRKAKEIVKEISDKNIFAEPEMLEKMACNSTDSRKLLKVRLELLDNPDLIPTLKGLDVKFDEVGKIVCESHYLNEALSVLADRLLMNPCDKQLLEVTASSLRKTIS